MAKSFLERVQAAAAREPHGKLADLTLAAYFFSREDPDAFLKGLKLVAATYGKPVVRATARAVIDAALFEEE